MRSLLKAGMAIDQSCALAGDNAPAPYRQWAKDWAAGCRAGRPLGEQMLESGERGLPTAIITAGERSGRLVELCDEIVAFYDEAIRIRNLIIGRSVYPIFLLHATMMIPVIPLWFLGKCSPWMVLLGPACLWTGLGLAWLAHVLGRSSGFSARLATRAPLRALVRPLVATISCQVLRAGAAAGMLWPEALRLAAASCGNRVYGARLCRAATGIEREEVPSLTAALTQADFPREVLELCTAAEHAGELEVVLGRAAVLQRERFATRVEWTARVIMGTFYAIAMIAAAITIVAMAFEFYIKPIQDIAEGL
ncbi:MAG: type II secretion system F family protein [Planctomycetota bacterium]|nr:type II secretion system F family protein [Planctomycetota bacterium]